MHQKQSSRPGFLQGPQRWSSYVKVMKFQQPANIVTINGFKHFHGVGNGVYWILPVQELVGQHHVAFSGNVLGRLQPFDHLVSAVLSRQGLPDSACVNHLTFTTYDVCRPQAPSHSLGLLRLVLARASACRLDRIDAQWIYLSFQEESSQLLHGPLAQESLPLLQTQLQIVVS